MNQASDREERDGGEERGLECSRCGCRMFTVYYTRPGNGYITRARSCRHCGKRLMTREKVIGGTDSDPR